MFNNDKRETSHGTTWAVRPLEIVSHAQFQRAMGTRYNVIVDAEVLAEAKALIWATPGASLVMSAPIEGGRRFQLTVEEAI